MAIYRVDIGTNLNTVLGVSIDVMVDVAEPNKEAIEQACEDAIVNFGNALRNVIDVTYISLYKRVITTDDTILLPAP